MQVCYSEGMHSTQTHILVRWTDVLCISVLQTHCSHDGGTILDMYRSHVRLLAGRSRQLKNLILSSIRKRPPNAVHLGDLLHMEVADTLRVAAMVQEFRRHGHLVARLDPLRRPARGPWLAEVPTHGSDQRWVC